VKESFGQKVDTAKIIKNTIYFDVGKQMMFSLSYERSLINTKHYILASQVGYGFIPGDNEPKEPWHRIIITGVHNLFGYKCFYLQLGITPAIYFNGNTTFINLNGDFGFRYQGENNNRLFVQLTYNPILFTTHNNIFNFPIGVGIGYRW
jgi:hypothetical protein